MAASLATVDRAHRTRCADQRRPRCWRGSPSHTNALVRVASACSAAGRRRTGGSLRWCCTPECSCPSSHHSPRRSRVQLRLSTTNLEDAAVNAGSSLRWPRPPPQHRPHSCRSHQRLGRAERLLLLFAHLSIFAHRAIQRVCSRRLLAEMTASADLLPRRPSATRDAEPLDAFTDLLRLCRASHPLWQRHFSLSNPFNCTHA